MTIFEIDDRIRSLIDEETGEIADYEAFDDLQMDRAEKIENTALFIKELKAEISAIEDEEKNLAKRAQMDRNKVERLKTYLAYALNGSRFKTPKVLVSYRKTQAVAVDDVYSIPETYLKYKEPEVDKVGIAKILKNGGEVAGCHLEERESVQIR